MPIILLELAMWILDGMMKGEREAWIWFFSLIGICIVLFVILLALS